MQPQLNKAEERENRTIAFVTTTALHVLLFLLLLFINAWRAPDPPLPVIGIELANLGNSPKGSGNIQTRNKPSALPNRTESKPAAKVMKPPVPEPVTEKAETKPIKTPSVVEQPTRVSRAESPIKAVEKPEAKEVRPVTPPKTKPTPKIEQPTESKPVEKPKVDSRGLYGKAKSNGTSGSENSSGGNNNGPDSKGVGDYGNPEGKVDGRGLYGRGSGGGGGSSLSMTGWTWATRPVVNDPSSEIGKIVIQIKVDDQGELTSVRIIEKTVSQSVAELYKRAVERISFVPTNSSAQRPASSTGTITFIIRSR
jgi:outer membrane biosynthesis protein TonB